MLVKKYENTDTEIIPRMYKGLPVRGFYSIYISHNINENEYKDYPFYIGDEKRVDIRKVYLHNNVNLCACALGSFFASIKDMQFYYEGTVEDVKNNIEIIASSPQISGVIHTLLDRQTLKFDGFNLVE